MRLLSLFLLLALPCHCAQAPSWVELQGGVAVPRFADCLKTSPAFGLAEGQWVSPRWGWEVGLLAASPRDSAGRWKAWELHLDALALYAPFSLSGPVKPFLEAGLGASRLDNPLSLGPGSTTRLNLMGGLGAQASLGSHLLVSLETRAADIYTLAPRTELQALLGIGLRWGAGPGPAPQPPAPIPVEAPPPPPPPAPVTPPPPVPVPEPAAPVPPAPEPPAPQTLLIMQFHINQAILTRADVEVLRRKAHDLLAKPGSTTLVITGHTCNLGTHAFNRALSLRRAQMVAKVLIAEGIPEGRVSVAGEADARPIASNGTRAGRARNRRAELQLWP